MSYSNKPAVIYAIRCKENGRMYVGSSVNVHQRVKVHFSELKNGSKVAHLNKLNGERLGTNHEWSIWQQDYNEYGEDAFEVYVLEENVSKEDRPKRETYWMHRYRSLEPKFGYNQRPDVMKEREIKYELPPVPEAN